jgi:hypothetical protein
MRRHLDRHGARLALRAGLSVVGAAGERGVLLLLRSLLHGLALGVLALQHGLHLQRHAVVRGVHGAHRPTATKVVRRHWATCSGSARVHRIAHAEGLAVEVHGVRVVHGAEAGRLVLRRGGLVVRQPHVHIALRACRCLGQARMPACCRQCRSTCMRAHLVWHLLQRAAHLRMHTSVSGRACH